jgi:hypothetical protein
MKGSRKKQLNFIDVARAKWLRQELWWYKVNTQNRCYSDVMSVLSTAK